MKVHSLADLKTVKKAIEEQAARAAAAAAQRALEAKQLAARRSPFPNSASSTRLPPCKRR